MKGFTRPSSEENGVTYDIYIRISDDAGRSAEELQKQVDEYGLACRNWAASNGESIGSVVAETNVSGSTAVAERRLDELLKRVEAGESAGVLTPYLDRFGRDQIEGCLAWRRIQLAGGRLVCVNDGLDSAQPGAKLNFQIRMAIAEDYLDRVRANFVARQQRAVKVDRKHLGRTPTLGYRRDEKTGRLVVHEPERELVRELFRRRARGANSAELLRWLRGEGIEIASKSTVVRLLQSRTFLGEVVVQTGRKGEPEVVKRNHEPLITEAEFNAAQRRERYPHTRDGSVASRTNLAGLVVCGSCGQRLKTGASGRAGKRRPQYVCTGGECPQRVSISAEALDRYVEDLLSGAFLNREQHIVAVMEGDHRYADAQAAMAEARRVHDEYRDDLDLQAELGLQSWRDGLRVRREALERALEHAATIPPPASRERAGRQKRGPVMTLAEAEPGLRREHNARFISKVVVRPGVRGQRVMPERRAEVHLVGSDAPLDPATVLPAGDPQVLAALGASAS